MSDDKKMTMPSSTAGITRYFDDFKSNISLQPGHIIVLTIIVMVLIILLHKFGGALLK